MVQLGAARLKGASSSRLVGVGLYTAAEAGLLIEVSPHKLSRWLRGHIIRGKQYDPLWKPQIDLGDDGLYLSFRDLVEAKVAAAFIAKGLSAQKVRLAISLARETVADYPLSSAWLKTDGRAVFLKIVKDAGDEPQVINLFTKQYAFNAIIEASFRDIDFNGQLPSVYWPRGRKTGVLIDPLRSFGQPIERESSIPAEVLAKAVIAEGSVAAAARAWHVSAAAVQRSVRFQNQIAHPVAA